MSAIGTDAADQAAVSSLFALLQDYSAGNPTHFRHLCARLHFALMRPVRRAAPPTSTLMNAAQEVSQANHGGMLELLQGAVAVSTWEGVCDLTRAAATPECGSPPVPPRIGALFSPPTALRASAMTLPEDAHAAPTTSTASSPLKRARTNTSEDESQLRVDVDAHRALVSARKREQRQVATWQKQRQLLSAMHM